MSASPQPRLSTRLASYLVRNPLIYLYTVFLGTLSLLSSFLDRSGRIQHDLARLWSWLILRTSSAPLTVEGLDAHRPRPARHLRRQSLLGPGYPGALRRPALPVPHSGQARALPPAIPRLASHIAPAKSPSTAPTPATPCARSRPPRKPSRPECHLVVFPEGGRCTDGHLQPFLGGIFYAAIKAQVPIVPWPSSEPTRRCR